MNVDFQCNDADSILGEAAMYILTQNIELTLDTLLHEVSSVRFFNRTGLEEAIDILILKAKVL